MLEPEPRAGTESEDSEEEEDEDPKRLSQSVHVTNNTYYRKLEIGREKTPSSANQVKLGWSCNASGISVAGGAHERSLSASQKKICRVANRCRRWRGRARNKRRQSGENLSKVVDDMVMWLCGNYHSGQ